MERFKKIFAGGIQHKVFRLVFITTLLTVAAFIIIITYQSRSLTQLANEAASEQQDSYSGLSSVTMNEIIIQNLGTDTDMEAYIADDVFDDLKTDVVALGTFASKIFEAPELWPPDYISEPDPSLDGTVCAQLMAEKGVDLSDPAVREEAGLIGNMSDIMVSMYGSSAQLNSCFIGTPSGLFIIADDRPGVKFDENGDLVSFPVTERPWFKGAAETGDVFFTDVETDAFTGAIGIVCSMPVYDGDKLVAVVGADLFLTSMQEAVVASDQNGSFVFIVNQNGHVVFSPKTSGVLMVQPAETALDLRECEEQQLASFVSKALNGKTKVRTVRFGSTDYYMAGAPLDTVGWALISVVNKETTQRPARLMQFRSNEIQLAASDAYHERSRKTGLLVLLLALGIFLLATVGAYILGKRIVMPLEKMTKRVGELGGDNILFEMDDALRTGDEIEILAESYSDLSKKTMDYIEEVREVTAEKERIGVELNMAKTIQESQLPSIFPAYPDRAEFDLFASMTPAKEVGGDFYDFFLVDDDHLALVIADVSGKGVPAALFMMIAKTLIKNRLLSGETPGKALESVNNQLVDGNEAEMFVTVWLAVLTISTGQGTSVNAGHEHPAFRRSGDSFELIRYPHSPALGVFEGLRFKERHFEMKPGDMLFVYTDGVPEAANSADELMGTDRMLAALNTAKNETPHAVQDAVRRGIDEFVAGAEQFDDITMLCLTYNGPAAGQPD